MKSSSPISGPLNRMDLAYCLERGKEITSRSDAETLFRSVHRAVLDVIPAYSCTLFIYDSGRSILTRAVSSLPGTESYRDIRLSTAKGIAGHVAKTCEMMVVTGAEKGRYYSQAVDSPDATEVELLISLPLFNDDGAAGALSILNPAKKAVKKVALLRELAHFAAIGLENTLRYAEVKDLSLMDGLTGLRNTRYLFMALEDLDAEFKRGGTPFSVIFMDIDNFKNTVDSWGHLNGSQAIQEVAMTIRDELKRPEFAVSYGGDEFVIVLPGCRKKEAVKRAMRIRTMMGRTVYLANRGLSITLTASFGIASYPEDTLDTRQVLDMADRALFEMKDAGKDGVMGIFD